MHEPSVWSRKRARQHSRRHTLIVARADNTANEKSILQLDSVLRQNCNKTEVNELSIGCENFEIVIGDQIGHCAHFRIPASASPFFPIWTHRLSAGYYRISGGETETNELHHIHIVEMIEKWKWRPSPSSINCASRTNTHACGTSLSAEQTL